MSTSRARTVVVALAAAACSLGAAPRAQAGDYTVVACAASPQSQGASFGNGIFRGSVNGGGAARDWCDRDLGMSTELAYGTRWFPEGGQLEACAPAGTRFIAVQASVQVAWQGGGYYSGMDTGSCGGYRYVAGGGLYSSFNALDDWHGVAQQFDARGLRLVTTCASSPCIGNWVVSRYKDVRVSVHDDWGGPALYGDAGSWNTGGWVRGTVAARFEAEDNVGIRRMRMEVDPGGPNGFGWPHDDPRACDFARLTPCEQGRVPTSYDFDSRRVADGTHTLRYAAEDSGGEWSYTDRTVRTDNAAPTAVLRPPASGDGHTLRWQVDDAGSGVDAVALAAAWSPDGGATWNAMPGSWSPADGTYSAVLPASVRDGAVRVRLTAADGAQPGGNASTTTSTAAVSSPAPGVPALALPGRWLSATLYTVPLSSPPPLPPSGVVGYSVSRDGSDPDATLDVGGEYPLRDLPEGTTVVKARAVSGSGAVSGVARGVVRVDRSAPIAGLRGAGAPGASHPGPVVVTVRGSDALSGMGVAEDDQPVTTGAHVAYRLDGAHDFTRVAGDHASLRIEGAGTHSLEYFAVDAAGNASTPATRSVVIGAPRLGSPGQGGFRDRTTSTATFGAARRFGPPCPAQVTLTADRDAALLSADPDTTAGAEPTLGGDAVVGFPLPAAPDCTVESATLRLYATSPGSARVRRAAAAWSEQTVTWSIRPGFVGSAVGPDAPVGTGWLGWNVTALVQDLYQYGDNGLYLRGVGAFNSREAAFGRPELTVRYSE